MKYTFKIIASIILLLFVRCNNTLKEASLEKEQFSIDTNQENIIETESGTVIMIPKGAFLSKNGDPIDGQIAVEFYEGFELADMIEANASMENKGSLLASKAIFNIEAFKNGEALLINKDKPLHIELAAEKDQEEFRLYEGERTSEGNIIWSSPIQEKKYLTTVDLESLDFLPDGFELEVEKGLPFRSHQVSSRSLVDSLFYSLSSYTVYQTITFYYYQDDHTDTTTIAEEPIDCGVTPQIVKALKSKEFKNTLIATKEFAERLKVAYELCRADILKIYVTNLDKNLWEIDEMAARHLGESDPGYKTFLNFSNKKLTNVRTAPKSAHKLAEYFVKRLKQVERELKKLSNKYFKEIEKQNEIAQKEKDKYRNLLKKRERYRMNKFDFELTKTGWYNVAKEISIDELDKFELTVTIENGDQFDRVHTYIVNSQIKSLFAMKSKDQIIFDRGYNDDPHLLMWKNQEAVVVTVAYKGKEAHWDSQTFNVQSKNRLTLSLSPISKTKLHQTLKSFEGKGRKNDIVADLKYQAFFEKDKIRVKKLQDERQFMNRLATFLHCCQDTSADIMPGI